ncbi:TolC family protein [Spirochaeta africana]|uniref:Outer membrane protein n=1 Tax=Spirochaeta africana (strain ATCC 700263 / DSM 8902 / Z-7692) TaxID=889378 RepID=H9UM78_SPIAZ|nr:TolC family protein [Spirochaeta africana]AFG38621.1 hypothetical protein Spiaf_2591 [Spirochaeta africana DSM 8902]
MKLCKTGIIISCMLLSGISLIAADDWSTIYQERLAESLAYRQAVLARRSAQMRVQQMERSFLPYLDVSVGQSGIALADGELQTISLRPELTWQHLFGADVQLSAPVRVNPEGEQRIDTVEVTVRRRLFPEDTTEVYTRLASLLQAQHAEHQAVLDVKIGLIEEIMNVQFAEQQLASSQQNLAVLERLQEAAADFSDEREIRRQVLRAQRGILQATYSLDQRDPRIRRSANQLYDEAHALAEEWLLDIPADRVLPAQSLATRAREYSLAAAELQSRRLPLAYLPNPVVQAGLTYDIHDQSVSWGVSLQISASILDRGERALEVFERRERPQLERLRLQQEHDRLSRGTQDVRHRLQVLAIDIELKKLEVEDLQEDVVVMRSLVEGGFEPEEEIILAEIELSDSQLELVQLQNQDILQRLALLRYYDSGVITNE